MEGKLVILSGPSGSGKTTLGQFLLKEIKGMTFSISCTSRSARPYETDGQHYHFVSVQEFEERKGREEFLEWEEVYPGQYYGTLKGQVDSMLQQGKHVLFDVDVKGGLKIKKAYGIRALAIFILPPSDVELMRRLQKRNTEDTDQLNQRISKADYEVSFRHQFDFILENEDLGKSKQILLQRVSSFTES